MELLTVGWCVVCLVVVVESHQDRPKRRAGVGEGNSLHVGEGHALSWRHLLHNFRTKQLEQRGVSRSVSEYNEEDFDDFENTENESLYKTFRLEYYNKHQSKSKSYYSKIEAEQFMNKLSRNASQRLQPNHFYSGVVQPLNDLRAVSSRVRRVVQPLNDLRAVSSRVRSRRSRRSLGGAWREGGEGRLMLEGGGSRGTGNVLVRHGGRVWAVCDDGWTLLAAQVVCRGLGYTGALGHTTRAYFGRPRHEIGLDNVQCMGDEESIFDCRHEPFGVHNCNKGEAAGVFCTPTLLPTTLPPATTTTPPPRTTRTSSRATSVGSTQEDGDIAVVLDELMLRDNEVYQEAAHLSPRAGLHRHKPNSYTVSIVSGRNAKEGRVEILLDGERGVICSDHWTLLEARVACRQAGLGLAQSALQANFFGGEGELKLAAGVRCEGGEEELSECYHEMSGRGSVCSRDIMVAGVVCTSALPDLVPNATLLASSAYLHDQPLYFMQCAMEENCAASSAFDIKRTRRDWHVFRRRLLRFSSSVWNFGTADFRPGLRKEDWEWHLCHMHYHSMQIFAHYDVLDAEGNRLAEGHKASFCLEDVQCLPNVNKKYACKGFGDQGISVGCADDYLHDIDCQWIDITDVKPGQYIFKVSINPNYEVAELHYNNNAVTCNMLYSGVHVKLSNCTLGRV